MSLRLIIPDLEIVIYLTRRRSRTLSINSPRSSHVSWRRRISPGLVCMSQDYGGPVGFRIVTRQPELLEWLIIQNTNAYEVGFTEAWAGLRGASVARAHARKRSRRGGTAGTRCGKIDFICHGSKFPALISPDNWNSDYSTTLQRPNARRVQMDLFYDYRTNVSLYPAWQAFLRERQPDTVIFWGQG